MPVRDEIPEEIRDLLRAVVTHYDKEDRMVRERQIRLWKKLEFYWAGFQRVWWSETAHDWRVFDTAVASQSSNTSGDMSYYDKPINVFRAYLESIIAVLSTTIPPTRFVPDDADNPDDVSTAKAATKISKLLRKHNSAPLLWLHALYTYCTQGMVACYVYPKEDKKFGTFSEPDYKEEEDEREVKVCPECGEKITPDDQNAVSNEIDEFMPEEDDVAVHDLINSFADEGKVLCQNCMTSVDPQIQKEKFVVTRLAGVTTLPKSRICMEVYGGLYVQVPNYAKTPEHMPYLILNTEEHFSEAMNDYDFLRPDMGGNAKVGAGSGGSYAPYERWGRLSTQYFGEYPINTVTRRRMWFRPWAFNVLSSDEDVKKLKKRFPDGVKVVYINDEFAEAENESLDDCWTITRNPLAEYIHFDPHGLLITSVQEITNDLISLGLQTIEHGIPQTMADPEVLNLNAYEQSEASPGAIYAAKPKSGGKLSDSFHELKTASLGAEVAPFGDKIEKLGEFASGAMPTIFGGAIQASSRTAAQYSMSRSQSLQRLQNPWKMFVFWWQEIFNKAVPAFIKVMKEDERFVDEITPQNFINVLIKKGEVTGKLGEVEIEADEQIPESWSQRKQAFMELLQAANPAILELLGAPENISFVQDALGMAELLVPGMDDREKQYEEIAQLVKSEPIPGGVDQTGQPTLNPSIMPEFQVDNHQIEADICRRYLVSEAGRQLKIDNPNGYKNVLLHLREHMKAMQMMNAGAPPIVPGHGPAAPQPNQPQPAAQAKLPPQGVPT